MTERDEFTTVADGDQLNEGYYNGIVTYTTVPTLINLVRMIQDRAVDFSVAQEDAWGEAYIDADGRNDSVDTGNTTAEFLTDTYYPQEGSDVASTYSADASDTFSDVANAFDSNDTTFASVTGTNQSSQINYIGKDNSSSSMTPAGVRVKLDWVYDSGNVGDSITVKLQGYTGSWGDIATLDSHTGATGSDSYDGTTIVGVEYSALRVSFDNNFSDSNNSITNKVYSFEINPLTVEADIYHTIPAGTFKDTISSSISSPLIAGWETGASIQYKLTGTGGSEDSGWLNINELSEFTAFTDEPDTLIIRLTPKSSSPSLGVPSIKGVGVKSE